MKTVTLCRPDERANKCAIYTVFAGNKKIAELKNNETKQVSIQDENKQNFLKAKIQWCGSNKIPLTSIKNEDTIKISGHRYIGNYSTWTVALLPITGVLMFGYGRDSLLVKYIGVALFLIIICYAIWILLIAKNKWLKLELNSK